MKENTYIGNETALAVFTLAEAPFETPLIVESISDEGLADRLSRLGLYPGSEIVKNDETLELKAVRVRTAKGDVILGGGMGLKTIVHLSDGRKVPILDMAPGESGHIEGYTGGPGLASVLEALGLGPDETITMVRKLPHMDYLAYVKGNDTIRLPEGDAAKLLGEQDGKIVQFSLSGINTEFRVKKILGGRKAQERIKSKGIRPGAVLVLKGVEPAEHMKLSHRWQLAITTKDGLHLHLGQEAGDNILVSRKYI